MAQRPTMHDVAAAAGVSQAVVSLVLNDNYAGRASEKTAERIRTAAQDLGYRTNLQAKSLKTGVAEILGLVGDEVATSPFSGMMIKGAQDRAWQEQHALLTIDTGGDDRLEHAAIDTMLSHRVRGIIYTAMYHRQVHVPDAAVESRAVCLNAQDLDERVPSVVPDEVTGGYEATKVLLGAGHTRIGLINIHDSLPAAVGRLEGYRRALAEAGIPVDEELIRPGFGMPQDGDRETRALMGRAQPPTAIFCLNDRTALGAYQTLAALGLRVPEDVSVVGFDDQDVLRDFFQPPLTTVKLPFAEMGQLASELLLTGATEPQVHRIRCPLVLRDSVAPPKGS